MRKSTQSQESDALSPSKRSRSRHATKATRPPKKKRVSFGKRLLEVGFIKKILLVVYNKFSVGIIRKEDMDTSKFIFLCGTLSIFFVSLFLFCVFWKNENIRLVGLYAILPGLNWTMIFLISTWVDFKQAVMVSAIMDFVFIVPIVYIFRDLYKTRFVVPWLLLIFEIFRFTWLILYGLSSRSKLTYLEADLYYFYYFVPFTVLICSILTRNKSNEIKKNSI